MTTCNSSTRRWNGCKNRARIHLRTWLSRYGFDVRDGPLDLWLCHVHAKGWEWQREEAEHNTRVTWVEEI